MMIQPELFQHYQSIIPQADTWDAKLAGPLPYCFWVNTLKIDKATLQAGLSQQGFTLQKMPWCDNAFRYHGEQRLAKQWQYIAGLYQIQEEVSMLPVHLLAPQPGQKILELCAAPGNKSAQISVAMQNSGTIIANDNNYNRLRAFGQIIKRLGLINISTTVYDAASYVKIPNYFDAVLADVPCSCEGTFRKRQDKKVIPNINNSIRMGQLQQKILSKAVQCCKPGGRIVYSTCTFAPQENEQVIDRILQQYQGEVSLLPISLENFAYSPGITAWDGENFDSSVKNCLRVWPHQNNSGGFFVAILEKTKNNNNANHQPSRHDGKQQLSGHCEKRSAEAIKTSDSLDDSYQQLLQKRFGFSEQCWEKYRFNDSCHRGIYLRNHDNQPPQQLTCDATGLFFLKTKIRFPKLSTAAARLLGPFATKNVIELNQQQMQKYVTKQDCLLEQQQLARCDATGYVIVCFQQQVLGVGLYFSKTDDRSAYLRSLLAKCFS